jgi:hypothetical protein
MIAGTNTLSFDLPSPFNGGKSSVAFSAGEGGSYLGEFETSLQLGQSTVAVAAAAEFKPPTVDSSSSSTLMLSGSLASFTLNSFFFNALSMNASMLLQSGGSVVVLQSLHITGRGSMDGLGTLSASFSYDVGEKEIIASLSLEDATFPAPFIEVGVSIWQRC